MNRYSLKTLALFVLSTFLATPAVLAGEFHPRLGLYRYAVTWAGLPAGTATVSVALADGFYMVKANARAIGAVDRIYRLRYEGEAQIDADDLSPIRTELTAIEGRKKKQTEMTYQEQGVVETVEVKSKGGRDYARKHLESRFDSTVFDPFAAILVARGLDWHVGMAQEFEVFTGSSHYRLELNAIGKKEIELNATRHDAWEIVPTLEDLDNPKAPGKVESVVIYLSADHEKELLLLESKLVFGNIRVSLEEFQPEN